MRVDVVFDGDGQQRVATADVHVPLLFGSSRGDAIKAANYALLWLSDGNIPNEILLGDGDCGCRPADWVPAWQPDLAAEYLWRGLRRIKEKLLDGHYSVKRNLQSFTPVM